MLEGQKCCSALQDSMEIKTAALSCAAEARKVLVIFEHEETESETAKRQKQALHLPPEGLQKLFFCDCFVLSGSRSSHHHHHHHIPMSQCEVLGMCHYSRAVAPPQVPELLGSAATAVA